MLSRTVQFVMQFLYYSALMLQALQWLQYKYTRAFRVQAMSERPAAEDPKGTRCTQSDSRPRQSLETLLDSSKISTLIGEFSDAKTLESLHGTSQRLRRFACHNRKDERK